MRLRTFTIVAAALLILASGAAVWSQTVQGVITGTITDPTGAVVPNATVTARRVETGDTRTTTSNETGNYIFPLVDSGTYEVTCTAAGFKTEVRRNVPLELNQKARLDFPLQVGQQAETVEVSAAAPLLETEDATLGSVVNHKRVVELPLNGRNFAQAATLMPGVVYAKQVVVSIGDCIRDLEIIAGVSEPAEMENRVEHLPL